MVLHLRVAAGVEVINTDSREGMRLISELQDSSRTSYPAMWSWIVSQNPSLYTKLTGDRREWYFRFFPDPKDERSRSGDIPSKLQLSNLSFVNWEGTAANNISKPSTFVVVQSVYYQCTLYMIAVVDLECSSAAPCPNMLFENINITPPPNETSNYICVNVINEIGLPCKCSSGVVGRSHPWQFSVSVCNSTW